MLNREDGSVDFARYWADYQSGFGNPLGEYWIGLDKLHEITGSKNYGLKIDIEKVSGDTAQSCYEHFSVGPGSGDYVLSISGFDGSSTAGDSMITTNSNWNLNNMAFTTLGHDNDNHPLVGHEPDPDVNGNCAAYHGYGGWWHNWCTSINPTTIYTSLNGYFKYSKMKFTLIPTD